jgi:[protein-PII] uridylyltransferase
LCTRDIHGLYAKVAGVMTSIRLNILGSHVYTSRAGFAVEVYRVSTPPGGREERELARQEFEGALEAVLKGELEVSDMVSGRVIRPNKPQMSSRLAPSVVVSNEESEFYTLVDVTTDDRIGLLYDLTVTIANHGFSVFISKAATILDQVKDTFYLKDEQGKKIMDTEKLRKLQEDLLEVVADHPHDG